MDHLLHQPSSTLSYLMPNDFPDLCSLDQSNHSFQGYAVSNEMNTCSNGAAQVSWKETFEHDSYRP